MTSHSAHKPRTLKLSRRPFRVFALALSPLLILAAALFAQRGPQSAVLFLALTPVILYATIIIIVFSQRITIRADSIETLTLFRIRRFIHFAHITRTEIQTHATPTRPVCAHIHTTNPGEPVITLSLKAIAPEDAAWFCALPALKAAGLRNRGASE
jgi:hypothetical protein